MSLGLYIHIPFCKSKCPYCDFFSISTSKYDTEKYANSLISAIKYWGTRTDDCVDTIYFGGGTPSLLAIGQLGAILCVIADNFNISVDTEVTIELNPFHGKLLDFHQLRRCGFNRLSVGLQSANENELKLLGRKHNANDVKNTVIDAQKAGFDNISLDLMIATPSQTEQSLKNSIQFCKSLGVQHVSSYILKVEEGTYYSKHPEKYNFPDDDLQASLYMIACEELEKCGFMQYEISNFARPGFESRHNLKYWKLCDYIGIGPSAHSCFNGDRFFYPKSFESFEKNEIISDGKSDAKQEYVMLSLRLTEGISFEEYKSRFGVMLPYEIVSKARKYEKYGMLTIDEKGIRLNRKGFLFSNTIIGDLL